MCCIALRETCWAFWSLPCDDCFGVVDHVLNCVFIYRYNLKKLTYEQRKERLIERLNALNSAAGAGHDYDDDEDDDE